VSGLLDLPHLRALTTADGIPVVELLRGCGVEPDRMGDASSRISDVDAYLELHIEQGPVLEASGRPSAPVFGCLGVRRIGLVFTGQAAHAGATPMALRHDPTLSAARFLLGAREVAVAGEGLVTVGQLGALPGTPTAVAAAVELVVDLRHRDRDALQRLGSAIVDLARSEAHAAGCSLTAQEIWSIDPVRFDPRLVARVAAVTGGEPLISGPLHDAAALASAGVPTAMLFVRSQGGISHSREEDSSEADLATAIAQFGRVVTALVQPSTK
jgi:N-carbamoyl-L-amino-acid hydrolase